MVTVGGLLAFATVSAQQQPLISYVRPLVGTSGYGNTYPGAQIPFGGISDQPGYGCRLLRCGSRI